MTSALLTHLPWDSSHFGFRIARAIPRQLDLNTCNELEASCVELKIECLYFLVDAAEQNTIAIIQSRRFDFVDIRLTLATRIADIPKVVPSGDVLFRLGNESDLEPLLPVARTSYLHSRFYVDPRFGSDKASLMYQVWLKNSLTTDFASAVVIAEMGGEPVGYACHLQNSDGEANIGLVGLAESARGVGCASGMLRFLGDWLCQQGFDRVNVVTQGRNIAAQRLYQRSGFVTRSVEMWFHKWFQ